MKKTGTARLTTHAKPKKAVAHVRRKGQLFTVHGAKHVRLKKPKKLGAAMLNLIQPT